MMMMSLFPGARCSLMLLLCTFIGLAGCERKAAPTAPAVAASLPLYRVCSDAHYAPFEEMDDQQQIHGFDIDLLNAIAERGGFRVKFVHTHWDQLFGALDSGACSILASSISITSERKQRADFSDPYFLSRQMIVVAKGEEDIRSFHDLQDKQVAVQAGTTGDALLQSLLGANNPQIKRFVSMADALLVLEHGGVDAVVGDSGLVINYVKSHRDSGVFAMQDTTRVAPEYYGFAVKKGSAKLLAQINAGLAATKSDGGYDALVKKYFTAN